MKMSEETTSFLWRLAFLCVFHIPLTIFLADWVVSVFTDTPLSFYWKFTLWLFVFGVSSPSVLLYVPPAQAHVMANTLLNLAGVESDEGTASNTRRRPELWSADAGLRLRFWWDRILVTYDTTNRQIISKPSMEFVSADDVPMDFEAVASFHIVGRWAHKFYMAGESFVKQNLDELVEDVARPFVRGKTEKELTDMNGTLGEKLDDELENVEGANPDEKEPWAPSLGIQFDGIVIPVLRPTTEYQNAKTQTKKAELRAKAVKAYVDATGVSADKALGAVLADEGKADFKTFDVHGLGGKNTNQALLGLSGLTQAGNGNKGGKQS